MGIFDIALLIVLCGFIFYGLFFGLVIAFGSLVSVIAGVFVATHFYEMVAELVGQYLPSGGLFKIIIFIAIFTIVNRLVSFLFSLLNKAFNIISIIPFLKSINRLAGAIFGLIEGLFVIGVVFYVIKNTSLLDSWIGQMVDISKFAPYIFSGTKLFNSFFPDFFGKLALLF